MKNRILLLVIPLILAVASGATLLLKNSPATATQPVVQVTPDPLATRDNLFAAVNAERAKYGAPALTEDPALDATAQAKACDEHDNHYHGHVNPQTGVRGNSVIIPTVKQGGYVDENLIWSNDGKPQTLQMAMDGWIKSPAHHEAMVSTKYTETGFGICGSDIAEHFFGAY